MNRTRSAALLAIGVVAAGVLSGCASSLSGEPDRTPPHRSAPPAGQVVFQLIDGPGYTPYEYVVANRPGLTVYGNGDAYLVVNDSSGATSPGRTLAFRKGTVRRAVLTELIRRADASGLFDDADFGTPSVTDLGDTSLEFHPDSSPARTADAYALYFRDAESDLTSLQLANRAAFRAFAGLVEKSIEFGDGPGEWTPMDVEVVELTNAQGDDDTAQVWPGPDPDGLLTSRSRFGRCGTLHGADAASVYAAARRHGSALWTVDDTPRHLVVRALLPGEAPCAG